MVVVYLNKLYNCYHVTCMIFPFPWTVSASSGAESHSLESIV